MRNYIVGITVKSADELADIGGKLRRFIDTVGDGTLEVQLAIDPYGNPQGNAGGGTANAIGFQTGAIEYVEDEDEGEDD